MPSAAVHEHQLCLKAAVAEHCACGCADDPIHLPHLIGPMKHYLWILKTTHGGADMDTCLEMAKGALDGTASLGVCVNVYSKSQESVKSNPISFPIWDKLVH